MLESIGPGLPSRDLGRKTTPRQPQGTKDRYSRSETLPVPESMRKLLQSVQRRASTAPNYRVSMSVPPTLVGGLAGMTVGLVLNGHDLIFPKVSEQAVLPYAPEGPLLKMTMQLPPQASHAESMDLVLLPPDGEGPVHAPKVLTWEQEPTQSDELSKHPIHVYERPFNPKHMQPPAGVLDGLRNAKRVLVICHTPPDGDTLGSGLGMRRLLEGLGKHADLCMDGEVPAFMRKQAYAGEIQGYDDVKDQEYDAVVMVDTAQSSQIGRAKEFLPKIPCRIVLDHHLPEPTTQSLGLAEGAPYQHWTRDEDATAVLVAAIAEHLGKGRLSAEQWQNVCQPLVTGLLTDTNVMQNQLKEHTLAYLLHMVHNRGDGNMPAAVKRLDAHLPPASQGLLMDPPQLAGALLSPQGAEIRQKFFRLDRGYSEHFSSDLTLITVPRPAFELARASALLTDSETNRSDLQKQIFDRLDSLATSTPLAVMLWQHADHVQVCIRSQDGPTAIALGQHLGGGGKPHIAAARVRASLDEVEERVRAWTEAQKTA